MRALFFFLFFSLLIFNCSNLNRKQKELADFVPQKAHTVIRTTNFESLKNSISNNDFLQKLSKSSSYKNLESLLKNSSLIKPENTVFICFSNDENDSLHYSIITKYDEELFKTDSLKNYTEEVLTYKNKQIIKSTLNNQSLYSAVQDSTFFMSSFKPNVDSIFVKRPPNLELKKIMSTLNHEKTCSVVMKEGAALLNWFTFGKKPQLQTYGDYLAFDIEASQNEIFLNGITKAKDSLNSTINIFKNTIPQENLTPKIAPSNCDGFISFTFNDYKEIEKNLVAYRKTDSARINTSLFNEVVEVGVIFQGQEQAIVLNSIDNIATKDALLNNKTSIDTYRQIDIFEFNNPHLFSDAFSPFISFNKASKYCVIENFFVFANSKELLQNVIANYQNKTTFHERFYYKNLKEHLSDESSILTVLSPTSVNDFINDYFEEVIDYKLKDYRSSALQLIYDNNFAHLNGVIKKSKTNTILNSVSEELNIKFESDLLTNPQFVKNHVTHQKEIVVQDIKNNLYLISNKGKILWKKQLRGPILGDVSQIDIYKNGRLQLCFATPHRVYVIDRKGRDVGPFPLKFNDNITQPLSVFDYDKKKNYRLLVTQGKNVLMYDVNGRIVNGFTFKSANSSIISQPKHFRIGSKDYIVFKTKNILYILDRTGKTRVKPKANYNYSNQPIFLYNNQFTTTTKDGTLVSVRTNGNVSATNLSLDETHYLTTTSKTLVALNDNKLTIKSKTSELDFGNYSEPKIFYINDKIYVAITDLQSHKIYLFDSLSKLIANFPVYGNSAISLDNIDKDKNLEFVTKGDDNSIILYQIN
ncbi:ribonuclease HII [Seonamhaeicola marinus]|uniref:Ribonuclease HII n=1 Tax=Seonamhaeicola marinus TaxID=1912246 RepID=A0A5D0HUD6_9FLAO|nr:ribonuclease HII [Seonamhaeicola marinus]TYA75013.1 ribonuclease HII [Seonamhaeicola marinus]